MKKSVSLLFFIVISIAVCAQVEPCKTMERHNALLQENKEYRLYFESKQSAPSLKGAKTASTIYRIPVVVHVLHLGTAVGVGANISDEQIYSAIESLNNAYRKKAGTVNDGNGVDAQMEFCLAQKNPFGAAHSGINRINASSAGTYGIEGITDINEATIKALSKWDHNRYYNIWVVSEIDDNDGGFGTQGYAYFPGAPASYDGAVMLFNAFGFDPDGSKGYTLKNYTNYNGTAIHELGHAFDLYHTFEGDGTGSTCPTDADCGTNGDCVSDTPVHKRSNSSCLSGINFCTGTSRDLFIHNYMDYSSDDCINEFTAGQAVRMQNSLNSGSRSTLVSSSNIAACGCDGSSAPISRFTVGESQLCQGMPVQFIDESLDFPVAWNWIFQGGIPATSTQQNPTVYYNGTGSYDVSLTTTSSGGQTKTLLKQNMISPEVATNLPFSEGFEGSVYPPAGWKLLTDDIDGPDSFSWDVTAASGNGTSTKAAFMNCYYYTGSGQLDDLITPLLNLEGVSNPSMTFNVSYEQYLSYADILEISVSADCGASWNSLYSKSGSLLETTTSKGSGNAPWFNSDWRNEMILLNSYIGSSVLIRFRCINDYGANIYIDDIQIQGTGFDAPIADFTASNVFPEVGEIVVFSTASTGTISSYIWDFGIDASLSASTTGAGPHFVTYNTTGPKTVTLTVINPENESDTKTVVSYINVMTATAIVEASMVLKPYLYPNPAARNVQIKNVPADSKILFINQIGEQVKSINVEGSEKNIDLSDMVKGVYTVLIQTDKTVYREKLVVQ